MYPTLHLYKYDVYIHIQGTDGRPIVPICYEFALRTDLIRFSLCL